MPRCGNKDIVSVQDMAKRKKRFVLYGKKWNRKELTYIITHYNPELSREEVDIEIERALKVSNERNGTDSNSSPIG